MADKRIKDLSTTATEADLVAGNYFALDGSAGTKKLPAEDVANATSAQKERLLFYLTSNTALQVDGYYNENSGKIWIKYSGDLAVRGKVFNTLKNRSVNLASLASELGVSLETSAGGMENSLPIATEQNLVYAPSSGAFSLKTIENVVDTDVVILANRGGLILCGCDLISIQYNQKIFESKNRLQIYCASSTPPYIEQTSTSGGALYFNCNSLIARGSVSAGWTMAQIASEVGVSLVTSPKGRTNCLQIPNVYNLVLTYYGKLVLRDRTKVRPTDYIILANVDGVAVINNIGQYQSKKIESLENSVASLDARLTAVEPNATIGGIDEYSANNDAFADSVKSVVGDSETLLFFSDPHCMGTDDTYTASFVTHTKMLVSALSAFAKTNSISKVICGGDFLRAGDTQFNAIKKIGYFTSLLKKLVGCIFALGNHDNNSQGKLDAESAPNTGLLTHAQQIAAEFVEQGSIYYKSEGAKTDYYILDTGSSPTIEMNSYRWEQIDWIANELLASEKAHGVVVMHIYSDGLTSDQWTSKITDFSANLQTVLGALNSRSSVTLNGHTYDFSDAVTKVSVILCGHTHYDYVDTTGNVPVVAITQTFPTYNSTTYSIDAIVLDYGALKMRCTRLGGEGSDRTITIVA